MLGHGDELGRTQFGNNNAYCHDSELTWIDWSDVDDQLLQFVLTLAAFRAKHRIFRRRRFFTGAPVSRPDTATPVADMQWFTPDGRRLGGNAWGSPVNAVAVFVNGEGIK